MIKLKDLKGKGPLIFDHNGQPTDLGLFDMNLDDKYDKLLTLKLAKKAAKNVLKKRKNIKESKQEKFKKLYEDLLNNL